MKKLLFVALCLTSVVLSAQNYYLIPYVGYGFGLPGNNGLETMGDTSTTTFKTKNIGLGGGINVGASFGVIIDDGVGVDFSLAYQNNLGQSLESTNMALVFGPGGVTFEENKTVQKFNAWSVQFTPSLRFEKEKADIKPFAQIGPSLIISGFKVTDTEEQGDDSMERIEKYSTNVTIGANAKAGVEFELTRDIFLVTALQVNLGYTSPGKSEITKFEVNGTDMMDQLDTRDRETNYEKEGDLFNNDPDQPSVSPRFRYDYSALGLIVGIKIILD